METRDKILTIVRRFAAEPIDPKAEDSLFESGLLDSFSLADMVAELESEFAIRIPDSDLSPRKFDSIGRIEAYVNAKRN
ncbi:MAG TPA: acyl carrier protein [Bryobacteraceae bacterium]|nr:acyl carrier protein [Bryobacteraceae bacterium]